ncbi:MAG: hypothetical protein OXN27_25760 [Candidatus Poribacteria bacterium]|nr:hypothetical protein [Candidatus Poribacteria bacterium]
MKKLTREGLVELASAYLKSVYISAPQWDAEKKAWVTINPHGTSTSSCGAPDFSGMPKTDADIKPHQRLMWQRCQRCHLIRPWGGCARNTVPYTKEWKR